MNNKPVSAFRLIIIWISLFSLLLGLTNLAATTVVYFWYDTEGQDLFANGGHNPPSTRNQFRFRLANYPDKDSAREIFRDIDRVQVTYKPYVAWTLEPYRGKTLTINASGERIHSTFTPEKNSGSITRFFGGSTLWGVGVEDAATIPALFNASHPELKVYNHGQFSYNSRQELALLLNLLAAGEEPGAVIFYDGVNDVAVNCRADTGINSHNREWQMRQIMQGYPEAKKMREEGPGLLTGLRGVFVGGIQRLIVELKRDKQPAIRSSWPENHWICHKDPVKAQAVADKLIKNWTLAHELVSNAGGRFQAVLQPVAFFGTPRLDHLEQEIAYWGSELPAQYAAVYPLLIGAIHRLGLAWISDASTLFDGGGQYYIDFAHVTGNGNARIAAFMEEIQQDGSRVAD